jgi:hypothetical protein
MRYGYERPTFYYKHISMLLVFDINSEDLVSPAGWSSYDFYTIFAIRLVIRCIFCRSLHGFQYN